MRLIHLIAFGLRSRTTCPLWVSIKISRMHTSPSVIPSQLSRIVVCLIQLHGHPCWMSRRTSFSFSAMLSSWRCSPSKVFSRKFCGKPSITAYSLADGVNQELLLRSHKLCARHSACVARLQVSYWSRAHVCTIPISRSLANSYY